MKPTRRSVLAAAPAVLLAACEKHEQKTSFLNVSYDPTREFYREVNVAFTRQPGGSNVEIEMSHGGSGPPSPLSDRRAAGRCRHARDAL